LDKEREKEEKGEEKRRGETRSIVGENDSFFYRISSAPLSVSRISDWIRYKNERGKRKKKGGERKKEIDDFAAAGSSFTPLSIRAIASSDFGRAGNRGKEEKKKEEDAISALFFPLSPSRICGGGGILATWQLLEREEKREKEGEKTSNAC